MGGRTKTGMGSHILPHSGYYSDEMVSRNRATTWNNRLGCSEGNFLLTFNFKDGFECIDEALLEIKDAIFKIPKEHVTCVQLHLSTKLRHPLECYNTTTEEGEEDHRNISILELEGQCEVARPKAEVHNISKPLKTRQVNIGSDAQLKFRNIGDY